MPEAVIFFEATLWLAFTLRRAYKFQPHDRDGHKPVHFIRETGDKHLGGSCSKLHSSSPCFGSLGGHEKHQELGRQAGRGGVAVVVSCLH